MKNTSSLACVFAALLALCVAPVLGTGSEDRIVEIDLSRVSPRLQSGYWVLKDDPAPMVVEVTLEFDEGILVKVTTTDREINLVLIGFPPGALERGNPPITAAFDEDGDLTNSGELANVFRQLALDFGVRPGLAATASVRGRRLEDRALDVIAGPGTIIVGSPLEVEPCDIIVVTGQLNLEITDTDFTTLIVSLLSPFHYAQYGDGGGLFSQVLLFGLDETASSTSLALRDDDGSDLMTDLNGNSVNGPFDTQVPAMGLTRLRSDGLGPTTAGSATVF